MKVKVGRMIFDSEIEPVMVILSAKDKKNIANMSDSDTKYAAFPDDRKFDEISKWMRTE